MPRRLSAVAGLLSLAFLLWGCAPTAPPPLVKSSPPPVSKRADHAAQPGPTTCTKPDELAAKPIPVPALRITPSSLEFRPGDLGAQLLADLADKRHDLTATVLWSVEPSGIVAIEPSGYVRRIGSGTATITARSGKQAATIPVTVADPSDRAWDFAQDIVPIFTRAGCNTGGCHGKAEGQNGFHLSLFGYDPAGDHVALTREAGGRRLSPLDPEQSLLIRKATGRTPHGGGLKLIPSSAEYQTLVAWIRDGAPASRGKTHGALTSLSIEPPDARLDEPGPRQLRVVAQFADGHRRDVTRQTSFRVNDDSAASIDPQGHAVLLRRAETDLIVRYQSRVVSTRLSTLINPGLKFDFAKLPRRNFIDDELYKRLESLKVPASPPATDAAFLRRVSLDLTGEQPTPEQVREFLADRNPEKRVKLVDKLLGTREFVLSWRIKLGDLLQITTARFNNGAPRYQAWVDEQLRKNTPWDQVVRTLLTALGQPDALDGGPVNYALDGPDPKVSAEQTAQRFLALRFRCAQCHDHPFDVWTQDDYFGLAACFAKVDRGGGPRPGGMMGRMAIGINPNGQVEHLRTKRPAEARLLDGTPVVTKPDEDPRKPLADWITSPDNPYFARAAANWAWAQFFGKGLADPPDDLSRSNPPVHPELLDGLAKHFVAHHYDLRNLIRAIATSEAYGLSSATVAGNERDTRLFSHQIPRPLTAHQMADALAQATDVANRYRDRPRGTRAIEVADSATPSAILETFGRCTRTVGCSAVATPTLSLRQSLLLIGGDVIENKVSHLDGYLSSLLQLEPEPEEIVENLYLRTVCRPATAEEVSHWSAELKPPSTRREVAEDLFWALLNSREFAFNH